MPTRLTRSAIIALVASALLVTAGCASDADEPAANSSAGSSSEEATQQPVEAAPEPADLTGDWKQMNSDSDANYQMATITADAIEVYWVADGGDTKSLYWAGTYEAPTEAGDSFTWDSVNDTSKTDGALLASGDATKTFTFENDELSYEVSAMGTTTTVRLGRE